MGTSGQVCETDVQIRYVDTIGSYRNVDFTLVLLYVYELCTHQSIQDAHRISCVYGVSLNLENAVFPCVL